MSTDHQILNDLIRGIDVDDLITNVNNLSDRELEVFEYLAQGTDKKTASDELFISTETFITHRKNVRKKIGPPYNEKLLLSYLSNNILMHDQYTNLEDSACVGKKTTF
jgi:FixJ family two-component response regulator